MHRHHRAALAEYTSTCTAVFEAMAAGGQRLAEVGGELTMLTITADSRPLMSRMHKPDPKLLADKQDKRSVIPIEMYDISQWLAPEAMFDAAPV